MPGNDPKCQGVPESPPSSSAAHHLDCVQSTIGNVGRVAWRQQRIITTFVPTTTEGCTVWASRGNRERSLAGRYFPWHAKWSPLGLDWIWETVHSQRSRKRFDYFCPSVLARARRSQGRASLSLLLPTWYMHLHPPGFTFLSAPLSLPATPPPRPLFNTLLL